MGKFPITHSKLTPASLGLANHSERVCQVAPTRPRRVWPLSGIAFAAANLAGPLVVLFSQNPFDAGELADHAATQAVRISATLVLLDLDQCAIEILACVLLARFIRKTKGPRDALYACVGH
jgi:hypothetical protein